MGAEESTFLDKFNDEISISQIYAIIEDIMDTTELTRKEIIALQKKE
jgi:hypothetical protein